MSTTKVTRQGWFSRLGGAITGVLIGIILIVASFPLLFWNEGRAVDRYQALDEGKEAVISVSADQVDPANEGELVHVSARATTEDELTDPDFTVTVTGLRLERKVEMYQWHERTESRTEEKLGGGTETVTTYTYEKDWSEKVIDSGRFEKPGGHQNPSVMPFDKRSVQAQSVSLGGYQLNQNQISRAGTPQPIPTDAGLTIPGEEQDGSVRGNVAFIGANANQPQVGDVRLTFTWVPPGEVSVIARQSGDTFVPHRTESGGTIDLLSNGLVSAEEMFADAESANRVMTWILRVVGFFLMFLGFVMVFRPLSVVADVVPFIGRIVGAGTALVAFLLSASLSLVTIAVAWVFWRPLIGVPLLVVAGAAAAFLVLRTRKAKPSEPAAA